MILCIEVANNKVVYNNVLLRSDFNCILHTCFRCICWYCHRSQPHTSALNEGKQRFFVHLVCESPNHLLGFLKCAVV